MDPFALRFPEGAVVCAPGDLLLCEPPGEKRRMYRVDDVLLVRRLVPSVADRSVLLVEEHLLDSMTPAYHNEIQLLLTEMPSDGAADEGDHAQRLLRPASELSASHCRVVGSGL